MAFERPSSQRLVRFGISVLIIGHLLAVVLPPLSLQTRGPVGQSPSVSTLLRMVEGYSQLLYIDRGYAFFAPDPGPSHLIQAAITDSGGNRVEQMFPDRTAQWPRLLYHRHFMLSEFMEEIYQPPGPPPGLAQSSPEEAQYWIEMRARYTHVRRSVVDHLRYVHPDHEVAVRRIEHLIPDLIEYQQEPIDLTDERLYRVMLDQAPASEPADEGFRETLPNTDAAGQQNGESGVIDKGPASSSKGEAPPAIEGNGSGSRMPENQREPQTKPAASDSGGLRSQSTNAIAWSGSWKPDRHCARLSPVPALANCFGGAIG